jgi:putative PEP-CTERM system TPR-repeat lipoprotein
MYREGSTMPLKKIFIFRPLLIWVMISVLFISGCNLFGGAEARFRKAVEYRDKGELSAAVIEFKNVLKEDPNNAEARWLLGKTYLDLNDGFSARKELLRAKTLGKTGSELKQSLVRAQLMSGDAKAALQLLDEDGGGAQDATTLALRGEAELALKQLAPAKKSFNASLAADPKRLQARYGLTRLAMIAQEYDEAGRQIEAILQIDPDDFTGLVYKAELALDRNDAKQAIELYLHALKVSDSVFARLGLSRAYLLVGKTSEAEAQLDKVAKNDPENPASLYLKAVAARQRNDLVTAKTLLLDVLNKAPGHYPSQLLLGTVQYSLGEYEQAVNNLISYLAHHEEYVPAKKVLAQSYMKLGDIDNAIKWLESAAQNAPEDHEIMSMLGNLYTRKGDYSKSEVYYGKALALTPGAKDIETRMALNKWASGDHDQAIADLTSIVDSGQDYVQADIALIAARMKAKAYGKALAAAKKLIRKRPDYAAAYGFAATAAEAMGDRRQARSYLEKSIGVDAQYINGYLMLARLDMIDGKVEPALQRLQAGLKAKPEDDRLLVMQAKIEEQRGNLDKARVLVERARVQNPQALAPRILLANSALHRGDFTQARELIKEALDIDPGSVLVLMLQARTEEAAGDTKAALAAYDAMLKLHPDMIEAYMKRGALQEKTGDDSGARASYQHVLTINEDYMDARLALGELDLKGGDSDKALETADLLQRKWGDQAAGYNLKGDVLMSRKEPGQALAEYRKAFAKGADRQSLLRLSLALQADGKGRESLTLQKQWLEKHPGDLRVRLDYAGRLQSLGDASAAQAQYEQILKHQPGNVVAMNNLAWLYQSEGKLAQAMSLAERAYKAAPTSPGIIDTYGWILVNNDQVDEGVSLLEKAVAANRDALDIRYHLASAHARAGNKGRAKSELEEILADSRDFSEREAARKLLESLR